MASLIEMPKLSDTMTEGTLLKWHVKVGDKVKVGKVIAEIQTDKANMEMEAFDDGTIGEMYVAEGEKVALGAKMALVLAAGESVESAKSAAPAAAAPVAAPATPAPAASTPAAALKPSAPPSYLPARQAAAAATARIKASPLAKKVAAALGVDLGLVTGTGPGGRIVQADVEAAKNQPAPVAKAAPAAAAISSAPVIKPVVGPDDQLLPISGMRRIIAERLLASKTQLPHFYLRMEVDAGPLMAFRAQINAASEKTGGAKYTVNDFVLKAVIGATRAVPAVNASWNGENIVQYKHVGLCVAVSVEDGLVTPVIKKAETKTLLEINQAVKDLATRAKDRKLKPDEFDGGTITVSNLGAWGIDHFDAIINPPQAAIVSVGAIRKVPVVNSQDQIVVGQRLWLGLSGDHRVVDGAVAAQFLGELRKLVENPALMLV